MRAQTPSYVVSTKIQLPESIANLLEKSFRISNSAYNEALSFGLKRFEALKRNSTYQELLEARRLALKGIAKLKKAEKTTKGLTQQVKCYNKVLFELRKAYGLTEFGLYKRSEKSSRTAKLTIFVSDNGIYTSLLLLLIYKSLFRFSTIIIRAV